MLKTLQREEWVNEVLKIRPLMMNEEHAFINIICELTNLKPIYYVFCKKGRLVISFISLTANKQIRHPFHFFYSSFWVDSSLSDTQYCQYLDEFVSEILKSYNNVTIKLPVYISDVRPFLWNKFRVSNYYTYIKDLDSLDYHPVTEKNIRKAKQTDYVFRVEEVNAASLKLNLKLFLDLKVYGARQINNIGKLMSVMAQHKFLKGFNCYKDDELVASNLILLDENHKIAYTVLLNKTSRANKDDVHSLLHDFFFNKLKEDGFLYVDLLGGDMKNIAAFKSRFNAKLQPHFIVQYNKNKAIIDNGLITAKYLAKKILKRFS